MPSLCSCLLAVRVSSWEKGLLVSFARVLSGFHLVEPEFFVCSRCRHPLLFYRFSFFSLDGVLWTKKYFILTKSSLSVFNLVAHVFGATAKKPRPNPGPPAFPLHFLLRVSCVQMAAGPILGHMAVWLSVHHGCGKLLSPAVTQRFCPACLFASLALFI